MEKNYRYNRNLVNRFVNDYKLPINMLDEKYFFYFLELYEKEYSSLTKWNDLWKTIDEKFDGNCQSFLDKYYEIREEIITTIGSSEAFISFNNMDMNAYAIKDKPCISSGNVYNLSNDGDTFLSIDLKKANFQALKYVDKKIVLDCDTYEEFIGKFTDLDYMTESKYLRQVVFGKLNPKRHITVEKYLINRVYNICYEDILKDYIVPVTMSSDEIVFRINDPDSFSPDLTWIEELINNVLGLEVRAEMFRLDAYVLKSMSNGTERSPFFVKTNLLNGNTKMMCVPAQYFALSYKLLNNIQLEENDYHFNYEGIDSMFMEEFSIFKCKQECVDLGLPSGTLWAKCNVGAKTETDNGLYFKCGDTKGIGVYSLNKRDEGTWQSRDSSFGSEDIASFYSSLYKTPTKEDFQELIDNTIREWTKIDGTLGCKFISKIDSSKYIFFPSCGFMVNGNIEGIGDKCDIWTSSFEDLPIHLAIRRLWGCSFSNFCSYGRYVVRGITKDYLS